MTANTVRLCSVLLPLAFLGCASQPEPTTADGFNDRGSYYAQREQFDRAIADFNRALELDPANAAAYNNRGLATAQGKRDYARALADYAKALELKPRYTEAHFNRGLAYRQQGDFEKAIASYSEALKISPRLADGYYNRAVAYFLSNRYDEAWQDLHKADSLGRPIAPQFRDALRQASGREK